MSGAECARCGGERASVHVIAIGVDDDAPIEDGVLQLAPTLLSDPDEIQVEAVCSTCGHMRYIPSHLWNGL